MKLALICATRNRNEKLQRMLQTISLVPEVTSIYLGWDGDKTGLDDFKKSAELFLGSSFDTNFCFIRNYEPHAGSVKVRNHLIATAMQDGADSILNAVDDIEWFPGPLRKAIKLLAPNNVIGLAQEEDHHPSGITLVGKLFLENYSGYQLFNPAYYHFAAQEVMWLAQKKGVFYYFDEPCLKHYHPAFYKDQTDQTHQDARKFRSEDLQLIEARKRQGLIWGDMK